tara:strand:- start:2600 stop:4300 length:1701 start_codon:yes stop_codon:yes gene_type:complete
MIRQPICVILGHVDHGKTTILDSLRSTRIAEKEAGKITQAISSHKLTKQKIKEITKKTTNLEIKVPGILFIDSPGHEAFTSLRSRGGNLADIAILVVDINEGLKPQTKESIEILKKYKTPFLIAANKIDLIHGWQNLDLPLIKSIESQSDRVKEELETKLYKIVSDLSYHSLNADRFDRVQDYTKQGAIVPLSAKTKQGLPELILVMVGLAQKYLEDSLKTDSKGPAKATVLEITEERGLGTALETIVYDGIIKKNDTIVIGTKNEPIVTKVKVLLDSETKQPLSETKAAANVKIIPLNSEDIVAGMPLLVAQDNEEELKEQIKKEVEQIIIETDKEGIIVKADNLGSLEAITSILKDKKIRIKKTGIGDINKKDITEATSMQENIEKVILGFNVKSLEDSKEVKILTNNIIYKLIEDLEKFQEETKNKEEAKELENIVRPCKMVILKDCIFRQSNPAVVGAEIIAGSLKTKTPVTKTGKPLTEVKEIQLEKKSISLAEEGKQVAISLPNVTAGRQVSEEDILYSNIPQEDFKKLKKFLKYLTESEKRTLKEFVELKRQENPLWGI